ncbi:SDR family oxidoreductase [Rhizobium tumorigenes]|uniref:SDR family oxidoreductase n=1 Tax=Rhizobium tumorigenes TaxID=2041385 RepID=UPI00241C7B0D|nr:SDR family oxidoreductase [Rhizobium tumorigenes]WFS00446.1 SDR family oxidoreductase [Rhizobium tumorigenes]
MSSDRPVILVTGGSRGIGAAISLLAAKRGFAVVVNYATNRKAAEAVVEEIVREGGEAVIAEGDVGSAVGVASMYAVVDTHFGRIDALVNNAGVVDMTARVDEMSFERIERLFRINVTGSIFCAAEAVKRMSTRHGGKGGAIVNISSVAATLGSPSQYVDYAASKGAIDTFTTGLAKEVAAEGIRVNAVRPGIVNTEIHASGGLPNRARDLAHLVPMRRPGEAQEIADAVLFLLSPSASYITGAILDVSGGR